MGENQNLIDYLISRELAARSLREFLLYVNNNYIIKPFHDKIISKVNKFISGEISKLMIFAPPQHGKSEITTRHLPAYFFGINPDLKIVGVSYSDTLAKRFNRDIQRIMKTENYREIFDKTKIGGDRDHVANTNEFEIVDHLGSYYSVGIGGGLTGRPVDVAIMDDVIKDSHEANSKTYRDRVWEWYTTVLKTRLHNDSRQILTITRWHEDDLAGRILEVEKDWDVLIIPAIDERGKAIWQEKHSLKKLKKEQALNPRMFEALYMQNPVPHDGNLFKREWFHIIDDPASGRAKEIWIDGAYTDLVKNDPTAILVTTMMGDKLLINNSITLRLELYELLKFFPKFAAANNYTNRDMIYIEPKASGKSLKSMLKNMGYNCAEIDNKTVGLGKIARAEDAAPSVQTGRVLLQKGSWNESFINECTSFPNAKHDDQVDNLCYAIIKNFIKNKFKTPTVTL